MSELIPERKAWIKWLEDPENQKRLVDLCYALEEAAKKKWPQATQKRESFIKMIMETI